MKVKHVYEVGPRSKRRKQKLANEKRPRTAFSGDQLKILRFEFQENRYLTEKRRQDLSKSLGLHENQVKIWFQNKRAKMKKQGGVRSELALHLMAQGLYNHRISNDTQNRETNIYNNSSPNDDNQDTFTFNQFNA